MIKTQRETLTIFEAIEKKRSSHYPEPPKTPEITLSSDKIGLSKWVWVAICVILYFFLLAENASAGFHQVFPSQTAGGVFPNICDDAVIASHEHTERSGMTYVFKNIYPASSTILAEVSPGHFHCDDFYNWNWENFGAGDGEYWAKLPFASETLFWITIRTSGTWQEETNPLLTASSSEPLIIPDFPTDCAFSTTTAPISFTATGHIWIPTTTAYIWTDFYVLLKPATSSQSYSFYEALPSLAAGQDFAYSVPVSGVATSSYFITYRMIAANPTGEFSITYDYHCLIHGIGVASYAATWIEISSYEIPEQIEDCSAQGIPDRWLCEIKNLLRRVFLPDQASLNQLQDTISQVQYRAPFNYIQIYKNYAQTLHDNVYGTTTLTFKLLGNPVSPSFTFLTATGTISTSTPFSLQQVFKWLTTAILLLILIVYFITFTRRIFK